MKVSRLVVQRAEGSTRSVAKGEAMPASLSTIGVGLWPGIPRPEVTAVTLCRQSLCVAAGTADGSIWLWRIPPAWHPFPKVGRHRTNVIDDPAGDGSSGLRPLALLCGQHEAPIESMVTAFEGKHHVLLSADSGGCMCVWRLEDGVCLKTSTVLSWGPREMVNVSCKGKTLIACCGPSPDIEVIDLTAMRRIVRLFGHGDWCTALCVRSREALMELDIQSSREPSIYSLDQGGTLCVWLAERSCSPHMVGWVPSVQCHRVVVPCPTSLVLDRHCASLMVVGRDAAAHYRLGRDHRLADKAAPPLVFNLSDSRRASGASDMAGALSSDSGGAATGELHDKAAAKGPETAAERRAKRLAAAARRGKPHLDSCGTAKARWTLSSMRGVLGPGGDRALVWRPHDALHMMRCTQDGAQDAANGSSNVSSSSSSSSNHGVDRQISRAATQIAAMCSDAWGWFALVSDEGDVCVWSAEEQSTTPARHLSAASALRSRHAAEQASPSPATEAATTSANADALPTAASGPGEMVFDGLRRQRMEGGELPSHATGHNAAAMAGVSSGGGGGGGGTEGGGGGTEGDAGDDMDGTLSGIPVGYEMLAR